MALSSKFPPQAYTRDTLVKAIEWLSAQPSTVRERATSADLIVNHYLQSRRKNESAQLDLPISNEEFKTDLRQLAAEFYDPVEPAPPGPTRSPSYIVPPPSHLEDRRELSPVRERNASARAEAPVSRTELRPETQVEMRPEVQPASRSEISPESRSEPLPETRPEVRQPAQTEMRPSYQPEYRPNSPFDMRPHFSPEARSHFAPEARSGLFSESRSGFSSEARPNSAPASRSGVLPGTRPNSTTDSRAGYSPELRPNSPDPRHEPAAPSITAGNGPVWAIDKRSLEVARELQNRLNLSCEGEAIRMLISMGADRARGLFF